MRMIAVSDETWERASALNESEPMSSDSLIALALDAYRILAAPDTPDVSEAALFPAVWRERRRKVLDGSHYAELAS